MALFIMILLAISATVQALMGLALGASIDACLAILIMVALIMDGWD